MSNKRFSRNMQWMTLTDKTIKSAFNPCTTINVPTVFPTFNVDELGAQVAEFKKKNPKLPTLPPNSVSGPAFKPFKPIYRPPTTPPILSDGTFAFPFKPGSTEAMHDNIRQLLEAGKFGGPKKPDGWDDDLIAWKKSPTGPTHPVSDAKLDKFIKAAKKAVLKKPAGITDEQWKALQAALQAAAGSEESSHDEL